MANIEKSRLRISLLGRFEAGRNGESFPGLHVRYVQWFLALLALRGGKEIENTVLAEMFWPEEDQDTSRSNVRQNIHCLKKALEGESWRLSEPTKTTRRLDLDGADVDIFSFEKAIKQGQQDSLISAVSLYRGPFLEGCPFAWAIQPREKYEKQYLNALKQLAQKASDEKDDVAAAEYLHQLVRVSPADETAQRALMQALASTGNYGHVIQVYVRLRDYLHKEYSREPDQRTKDLYGHIHDEAKTKLERPRPRRIEKDEVQQQVGNIPCSPPDSLERMTEVATVTRLLLDDSCKMVVLTGAGGMGKTWLANRVAEQVQHGFPHGAWCIDLAPLADPTLVPQAVAAVLRLRQGGIGRHSLTESLVQHLKPQYLLLVLDNCEHLVDACAGLTQMLLQQCPNLRILATSREPLGLPGWERTWSVPPLAVPDDAMADLTPETARRYDSADLFIRRARAASPAFALSPANLAAVVEICRCLDGIPLAIELAAARVRTLSPAQVAARLKEDVFPLLTVGNNGAQRRHQTLRATIDWSYGSLEAPERVLLRRLSVFAGGCTLEAATTVCCGGVGADEVTLEEPKIVALLDALVHKSLVLFENNAAAGKASEPRYRLLEPIRQYGRDRLVESGEAERFRQRHLDFFLDWVQEAASNLTGSEQVQWLERLATEHDNLRAAIAWSRSGPDTVWRGLNLCRQLSSFWCVAGHTHEGLEQITKTLELVLGGGSDVAAALLAATQGEAVEELMRAFYAAAILALFQGDSRALSFAKRGWDLSQATGQKGFQARLLWLVAELDPEINTPEKADEKQQLIQKSLQLYQEADDQHDRAEGLVASARLLRRTPEHRHEAVKRMEDALHLYEVSGHVSRTARVLNELGGWMWATRPDKAIRLCERALELGLGINNPREIGEAHWRLGMIALRAGRVSENWSQIDKAVVHFRTSIGFFRRLQEPFPLMRALAALGQGFLDRGEHEHAQEQFRECLSRWRAARYLNDSEAEISWAFAGLARIADTRVAVGPDQGPDQAPKLGDERDKRRAVKLLAVALKRGPEREEYAGPRDRLAADPDRHKAYSEAWHEGWELDDAEAVAFALGEHL